MAGRPDESLVNRLVDVLQSMRDQRLSIPNRFADSLVDDARRLFRAKRLDAALAAVDEAIDVFRASGPDAEKEATTWLVDSLVLKADILLKSRRLVEARALATEAVHLGVQLMSKGVASDLIPPGGLVPALRHAKQVGRRSRATCRTLPLSGSRPWLFSNKTPARGGRLWATQSGWSQR
jgi:hypothetical protein